LVWALGFRPLVREGTRSSRGWFRRRNNWQRISTSARFAKAEELKKRIWFTLGALLVYRLGTYIPLPGIDPNAWDQIFQSQQSGILGMFNMFARRRHSPHGDFCPQHHAYISASIIIQLDDDGVADPRTAQEGGEAGRKLINQYTAI